jgi:hypothetical protein
MNRLARVAAAAALAVAAVPATAQDPDPLYTPPAGPAVVPAPPGASPAAPVPRSVAAPAEAERTFAVSAQIGTNFGGTVTGEQHGHSQDYGLKSGFVGLTRLDLHVVQRFTMGVYGQVLRAKTKADHDMGVNGLGLSLIGRFGAPTRTHLRLGMLVGYQGNTTDVEAAKGSRGLGLGALTELAIPVAPGGALLAHVSFLTQPIGGNGDVSLTFGPVWYAAVGAEFGR